MIIYTLGYSWQDSNDIIGSFITLQSAQAKAEEGLRELADKPPRPGKVHWKREEEDGKLRWRASWEDMQYVVEAGELRGLESLPEEVRQLVEASLRGVVELTEKTGG